jgi:hypothetical protein
MDDNQFSRRDFFKKGLKLTGGAAALGAVGNAQAAGANSIVTENAKTGTPPNVWDISGGQYSGFGLNKTGVIHYIEGFADNISVNSGTVINFKINTDSTNYRIDVYRLGYYQGNGARLVATSLPSGGVTILQMPSVQPTPLTNIPIGLIDAGNWSVTASWTVPADAVSGVYIAKLTRLDIAGANHIPFVVRDDANARDIIFQTSDTTWQAYNGWGGYNLYGGAGKASSSTGRAYQVSYNRPFATRDSIGTVSGPQDFVFGAEVCAIRWLEQNGYDVCYMSGCDVERLDPSGNGAQLINKKIYLSVGHDEYWSGVQRANVEAARAAGVHLAFWSGNEIFWKTRWLPSIAPGATPYRTLVCYKETIDGIVLDPADPPTWTGSWRDPSFSPPGDGNRPENALSGTIFMVDSWRSDIIKIPAPLTQLRFWRNTSVAAVTSGSASLVKNLLGYEWDEAPDNGFQPAGLIRLSSTTLSVDTYLLDYGHVVGTYTGTHNLTLYRFPGSNALVFGAGTVFWVWGLDSNHDLSDLYPTAVDKNVQQATVNLFADMGVQPASLVTSTGIVAATQSADATPPTSTINIPGPVTAEQQVTITGTASDIGGLVAGVEISTDGGLTWHPCTGTTAWTYTWWAQSPGTFTLKSRAVDDSGNLEAPGAGISVTVAAGTSISLFNPAAVSPWGLRNAPAVVGPANDANAVELGIMFQVSQVGQVTGLRFYKNPWNTGVHVGNLWSATGTLLASSPFTGETPSGWQTVTLPSSITISANTTYIASFHSTGGHYSNDDNYFASQRVSGALKAPPTGGGGVFAYGSGSSVFPANNDGPTNYWADVVFAPASGALPPVANNDSGFTTAPNTALAIPAASLLANDTDPNGFTLTVNGVSNPTGGTVAYDTINQTVTFTPTTNYAGNASFNYTVTNGQQTSPPALVSLTVAVVTPTSSLFAANSVPTVVTENDHSAVELGLKFQVTTTGKATGVRFYKGSTNTGTHVGNLWSSAGALLTSVTFANETASGWQQALFPNGGVALTPGATYIISYHTNVGFYSADGNFFANALTNAPLTAPSASASGGNGVYAYGAGSSFPSNTFGATNYWVDVVFSATPGGPVQPPVANNDSGFTTPLNTSIGIAAANLLANDTDPQGLTLSITAAGGGVNGTAIWNAASQVVTFTPTTNYSGPASFTYTISNGQSTTTPSATVSLTVTSTAPPATSSLFSTSSVPGTVSVNDTAAVELGMKFQVSSAGQAKGVRFYKGPKNTGTHTGHLWSSTGTLLASVTFAGETASGWQQALFPNGVALTAGTIYVISYHTSVGFYSANSNFFAAAVTNGPITAPSSVTAGGNGVYIYGSAVAFPKNTYQASNYWVDLVFG